MSKSILLFPILCMFLFPVLCTGKSPAELTDEEVLNLKPGSAEHKARLMWEFTQVTGSNELYSASQDIPETYPNDPDWVNFFGKLLKDAKKRKYAMLALGYYKARKYEVEILSLSIENKMIVWDALYSLVSMNSPLLPIAVKKARVLMRDKPDLRAQALLNSIEKTYRKNLKK